MGSSLTYSTYATVATVIKTYCSLYPGDCGRVYSIAKQALAECDGEMTENEKAQVVERWLCTEL